MSINTAHAEGGVLIHQGEMILLHASNATITFSGSDDLKFGEKSGNAYLTTHRLIFLAGKNSGDFKSFSFPFCVLSQVDVEQPMFGANFLKGKVRAQPDGGWRGEAKFKVVFKSGGAIDFAQGMVGAMQIAKRMSAQSQYWNSPPPSYASATAPGGFMPAPPSYYSTPSNYYGWMPPAYNFPAPAPGTVYMSEAPPPYPGIGGEYGGMPPQQSQPPQGYYPQQVPQSPEYNTQAAQAPGYYPQQQAPAVNGYYAPQQAPVTNGYYAPQQSSPYPVQQMGAANSFYPHQAPGSGYYPPPAQNGFAYANGNQAFVPSSAPPPYDDTNKKFN